MLGIREGANIAISRRNFFVSVPKISVGESFTVALISGIEKVWIRGGEGVSRFSVETFLSHGAEKLSKGPFSVSLIRVSKTVKDKS